ncbi:MAG: peptidoglycan DD-metalloendopeptidase family protein [candidate division WOR-3 bacterium]
MKGFVRTVALSGVIYICVNAQGITLRDSIALVQRQLDSTLERLDDLTRRVTELAVKEKTALERLELLQEKIALTENLIRQLEAQIDRHNREINELNAQLAKLLKEEQRCRNSLSQRLLTIYKYSKIFPLQAFLTTKNLPEFYRRVITLRLISRSDRRLLLELMELNKEVNLHRQGILAAQMSAESLEASAQEKRRNLMKDKEEENRMLLQIRTEKLRQSALKNELQSAAERLKELVADLQIRASSQEEKYDFEKNKGRLPWPVTGSIIASFGIQTHPRYHTKVNNTGIDIKVKEPSEVKVVAAGKVSYADRFIGYGNLVIIDHGNGYFTLYGNLSTLKIAVGASVSQGSGIGTVDDYLHFEIRREGQPLNPKEWLE